MTYRLGDISSFYESGHDGFACVNEGYDDPGGASYGKYQLSSRAGTLQRFLEGSGYSADFEGMSPGSSRFNETWKKLAHTDTDFCQAQWDFVHETIYTPVANLAWGANIAKCLCVGESIWSMAVQHGRAKLIVQNAIDDFIDDCSNKEKCVRGLYASRINYVDHLTSLREAQKISLKQNRYGPEMQQVLNKLLTAD